MRPQHWDGHASERAITAITSWLAKKRSGCEGEGTCLACGDQSIGSTPSRSSRSRPSFMALSTSGGVSAPLRDLARDPQRLPGAVRPGRVTRELLVRQVGVVLDRAGRFHDVDPAGTFADRQLRPPDGRVQRACQVDVRLHAIPVAEVGGMPGLDQVTRLQVGLGAVEEPPHTGAVTRGAGLLVDGALPLTRQAGMCHDERARAACALAPRPGAPRSPGRRWLPSARSSRCLAAPPRRGRSVGLGDTRTLWCCPFPIRGARSPRRRSDRGRTVSRT